MELEDAARQGTSETICHEIAIMTTRHREKGEKINILLDK